VIRKAAVISVGLHAAVLVWASVSFSGRSTEAIPTEALPIDIVSESQLTQLTKGAKDAEKKPDLKPLVEKIAPQEKTADESKPKVTEKQEVEATKQAAPPPPMPEPKPVEKKEAKPAEKPEPKPAEKKEIKAAEKPVPVAKDKVDPIAEELKKEPPKKEAKAEPKPMPPKKPPAPQPVPHKKQPEFDPAKIAALLDQRAPQRHAATGAALNSQAALGRANGTAVQLSANEIEAFRRRVSECWQPPLGADGSQNIQVVFRVMFNADGTVKRGPDVVEAAASSLGPIFAESTRRALLQCQPYTMLRKESYEQWKDLELAFNLRDMFR
jgi:colicin import membrane protein